MPVTNAQTGTRIDEVGDGLYRISTPVPPAAMPGGFSFNQYLLVDDEPLLFHTGLRRAFPLLREAIEKVMPVERLRWLAFSHVEADECGALNDLLAVAPGAQPLCSRTAAQVSIMDLADRAPRGLSDGETLSTGKHQLVWFDTPHLPHGWECGYLFDQTARTLFCGDLFTQPGHDNAPLSEGDILEPSEAMRAGMDYFAHAPDTAGQIRRLAAVAPTTLACMHGSAWRGDGAKMLQALAGRLARP